MGKKHRNKHRQPSAQPSPPPAAAPAPVVATTPTSPNELNAAIENLSLEAAADATEEEIEFLKLLRFRQKRPNALYYYRELQNLRDPLHFAASPLQPKKD